MKIEFDTYQRDRKLPEKKHQCERMRVVIDSDANGEIDDQWAIALAILSPARFQIEAFVGAHFDNPWGGPDSVEASAR